MLDRRVEAALRRAYPALTERAGSIGLADLLDLAQATRQGQFALSCQDDEAAPGQGQAWIASDQGGKVPASGRGESAEEAVAAWLLARLPVPGWQR